MPRSTSCGTLIINERGEVLLAHATGARHWDIPKGLGEAGESPLQTALRETAEEVGVALEAASLGDLGVLPYLPAKDLHLFVAHVHSDDVDPARCRCTSFFEDRHGRSRPEADAFRWACESELATYCTPRMAALLARVLQTL